MPHPQLTPGDVHGVQYLPSWLDICFSFGPRFLTGQILQRRCCICNPTIPFQEQMQNKNVAKRICSQFSATCQRHVKSVSCHTRWKQAISLVQQTSDCPERPLFGIGTATPLWQRCGVPCRANGMRPKVTRPQPSPKTKSRIGPF